jgi:hypothetical protein
VRHSMALTGAPRSTTSSPSGTAPPWNGINAKDYGAVGDGTTDDAPALQRAIAAATEGGQALLLPAGTYLVNTTLSIPFAVVTSAKVRVVSQCGGYLYLQAWGNSRGCKQ